MKYKINSTDHQYCFSNYFSNNYKYKYVDFSIYLEDH